MGRYAEIANPFACARQENSRPSPATLRKQRVSRGAVGGSFVAVRADPGDLGFELRDARIELGLRIGAEILGCETTRSIPFGAREIGFFHCRAASQAKRLAVNPQGGYLRGDWASHRVNVAFCRG
jgi:hypothetical protein